MLLQLYFNQLLDDNGRSTASLTSFQELLLTVISQHSALLTLLGLRRVTILNVKQAEVISSKLISDCYSKAKTKEERLHLSSFYTPEYISKNYNAVAVVTQENPSENGSVYISYFFLPGYAISEDAKPFKLIQDREELWMILCACNSEYICIRLFFFVDIE